jgi:hypothetical protein
MNLDLSTLPDSTSALKELIVFFGGLPHTDLEKKSQIKINFLEESIRLLQNELFGRKTEKHIVPEKNPQQLCLFDEPDVPEPEKADTICCTDPRHGRCVYGFRNESGEIL